MLMLQGTVITETEVLLPPEIWRQYIFMKGSIFKIKEGKEDTWKLWCLELAEKRYDEALETLKEEGLNRECGGVFNIQGTWYGYILTDKDGIPSNKDKEINQKHRDTIRECREGEWIDIDTLYSLELE